MGSGGEHDDRHGGDVAGPRAGFVLLGTAVAAAVVVGGVLGYRAWRDRDDGAEAPVDTPPTEPTAPDEEPVSRLFTRTTDGGVEIRVDSVGPELFGGGPNPPGAPAFCEIVGAVTAFAITDEAIVQTQLPLSKALPPELSPLPLFDLAGSPLVGVVVQVADDVTAVRLTTPSGEVDEMEPVDGIAALAVRAPANRAAPARPGPPRFGLEGVEATLTARHGDGRIDRVLGDRITFENGPPAWRGDPACFPDFDEGPVETMDPDDPDNPFAVRLPPAGAEQPADPATAQAQIAAALDQLYGAADPAVDPLLLVDDPFAVREMLDKARELSGENGEEFDDAAVVLEEIVFLSTVEAAYEYTLETSNLTLDEQFGRAHLVDGTWRITRSTLCRDLGYYGVTCPP